MSAIPFLYVFVDGMMIGTATSQFEAANVASAWGLRNPRNPGQSLRLSEAKDSGGVIYGRYFV